jgi:hypothetical protein
MRIRRVLIALFALGTIGGYGSAIAGGACHARARRAAFERHVAHLCADAARNPGAASAAEDAAYPPW